MPLYTYKCQECDHVFEDFVWSHNTPQVKKNTCPECGGESPRSYANHMLHAPKLDQTFAEDPEEYREMHYYEKQGQWERAAKAAEGVSEFARKKFLEKARTERN